MIEVLRKRADYLAANRGVRVARPGFVLLVQPNRTGQLRYGITVTKKIGNAVIRNRIKRRFRALFRGLLPQCGIAGHDHVLIARHGAQSRDYAELERDLAEALRRAAAGRGDPPRRRRPPGAGTSATARGGKAHR